MTDILEIIIIVIIIIIIILWYFSRHLRFTGQHNSVLISQDYSAAELEELCDISRLPRQLRAKMSHRAELLPPIDKNAATVEKQRMLYASLGEKSGG